MKVEYSILKYTPDLYTGEVINIGVAYHNLETDQRDFEKIKNFSRLWTFDDELDTEFTSFSIEGFAEDWKSGSLFNEYSSLKEYTRFFVNEFYFSKIKTEEVEDYKEFILLSSKYFLRKSLPKKERLSRKQRIDFLEAFLRENSYNFNKKKKIAGIYDDSFTFDYVLENSSQPIGIKYISNTEQSINILRSLLFYAEHNSYVKISVMLETDLNECLKPIEKLLVMAEKEKLISIVPDDQIDKFLF
ncbi:DUF3037 domain-containing protein [Listeria monocytogenes]|nr:DUF3037 domain-containing protein [Listeria monocytogenes]